MRETETVETNRGQAYTLEGIIGAIVIASALIVGLQAVDPSPWTEPDPVNPEELRTMSADMLDVANDRDLLRESVSCADLDGELEEAVFTPGVGSMGNLSHNALGSENYRITIAYIDADGLSRERVYSDGSPSRNSVTTTQQFGLFDSDSAYEFQDGECVEREDAEGERVTLAAFDDMYIDNQDPDEELYAMVKIKVVVW